MKDRLNVHFFQHINREGFGSCEGYLRRHQARISATEFFKIPKGQDLADDVLPAIESIDVLIIMGGPMSVNDEVDYPWLRQEKTWIKRFIDSGRPVVGLCLGGQLIANALGAQVKANPVKEIGWTTLHGIELKASNPSATLGQDDVDYFQFPPTFEAMQWHGETFDLPEHAVLLASNPTCHHQAYQLGKNVIGCQFHPEITPHAMQVFLADDEDVQAFTGDNTALRAELNSSLLASEQSRYQEANDLLNQMIDYVVKHTDPQLFTHSI